MYELRYSNGAQRYFKKIKEEGLKKVFKDALCDISADPYLGIANRLVQKIKGSITRTRRLYCP